MEGMKGFGARLCLAIMLLWLALPAAASRGIEVGDGRFLRDGHTHVIRAGELHYARIPREYWRDRLRKARAMGLNAVQTYVFWHLHEPEPGTFDFSGNLDVAAFVRMAQEEGLDVILRPGPYICTEADFGGLPAWLLRTPGLRVRSFDPRFLRASAAWMARVGGELAPLQATRGGPIVLVQVENEYGSYGNDRDYMAAIRDQVVAAGFDVPLFTSDGGTRHHLEGGSLPDAVPVVNFNGGIGSAEGALAALDAHRPRAPRMVGEYWAGWFDHWGERHHATDAREEARTLDWLLQRGVSFSIYMFHGGTSFGYLAGANAGDGGAYQPDTTSYDYDAPLDEAGRPTAKFHAFREVMRRHLSPGEALPELPASAPTIAIARFGLDESASLADALPVLADLPVRNRRPLTMEELGQSFGFVLYRNTLASDLRRLSVDEVRDYAVVLGNGRRLGTLDRRLGERELEVGLKVGDTLDLLVENMGRINFGPLLDGERKGITRSVSHAGGAEIEAWETYSLPLGDLSRLPFRAARAANGPAFWRGHFTLGATGDTFLDTRGWGKGHVWVNGHHLGRYWKIGPQQTLFVPGAWLRAGRNEVIVLDVEGGGDVRSLQGVADPVFDTPGLSEAVPSS